MERTLPGYRVERLIGRGGMGEVHLARDLRLDRPVALKVLSPELAEDERFRERLLRESRLAAALDHPNVVPIYEAGEADGRLFIAMRYVDGTDLRSLLRQRGALAPERAIALTAQIAGALDAAHARGLVHRDVKPSNVLVDDPGGRDHCYLADFGLTQSASDRGPADGSLMGTLDYVAPEQIRGEPVHGRADQYALACLLYECLTGSLPFRRDSEVATIVAHLEEAPPAASDRRAELPPALDAVLGRAMAKDPDARFESCGAFVDAAGDALGLHRAPSSARRAWLVAGIAAALLAAVVVAALVSGGSDQAAAEAPGALVRLDPSSGATQSRVGLEGRPGALAIGAGRVWVGSYEDGGLWRLDPGTDTLDPVESVGVPRDLAARGARVYVASDGPGELEGNVVAYDATSGARLDGLPLQVCSIAASAREGVWSTACPTVQKLGGTDRRMRVVRSLDLPFREPLTASNLRSCQCDLAVGDGAVWVEGDAADSRVWRIDPATATVTDTIEVPFVIGRGIAAGGGALWVAGPLDDIVARIDARTGRITDRIRVGRAPVGLALRGDRLWVANSLDRTVAVVNTHTRRVVKSVDVGGRPDEVAAGAGGIWVTVDG